VLPSRLPNLLVNGSSGIAVGMATNIPPHNLGETVTGCLAVLDKPEITVDELLDIIPAPDFPTAGIIYGLEGVREGYRLIGVENPAGQPGTKESSRIPGQP